jgi:hypothetical protein
MPRVLCAVTVSGLSSALKDGEILASRNAVISRIKIRLNAPVIISAVRLFMKLLSFLF